MPPLQIAIPEKDTNGHPKKEKDNPFLPSTLGPPGKTSLPESIDLADRLVDTRMGVVGPAELRKADAYSRQWLTGMKLRTVAKEDNRAVGYVRVSTEEQARHGFSLGSQAERIRAYCTMSGLELQEIVSDEGVSASKRLQDRPGGAQITDPICRHVVAVKLDRLFRDAQDALEQTKAWDQHGIALHLIDMGGATVNTATAMGRFFLTMMAGFAELERNLIAERTSTALRHKKATLLVYGPTPYGYATDGSTLSESHHEQTIVAKIRSWRLQGWTLRAIADALNAMDVTRKRGGKRWYASTVNTILHNNIHTKAA